MPLYRRAAMAIVPIAALLLSTILGTMSAAHAKQFTIAFLPKQVNNSYFTIAFNGAKIAAKADGDKVLQTGPTAADASQQVTYINSLVQQHVNAIVISGDDPNIVAPALKKAMA